MKLINILLDFENTTSTFINENNLTQECLDALKIVNCNSFNSRGVLVRGNNSVMLLAENRFYNGYILDLKAVRLNQDLFIEFISPISSCNISTQLGYDTGRYCGNLSVVKCDESMPVKLSFYGAAKDRAKNLSYLIRGDLVLDKGRVRIASFENCDLVPIVVENTMFDFLYRQKGMTCYQIFHIVRDVKVMRQYEQEYMLKYGLGDVEILFDQSLSYTNNDLL
jgi:hypothetical protein